MDSVSSANIAIAEKGGQVVNSFMRKTYLHLFAAIALFVGIEYVLFSSGAAEKIAMTLLSYNWLIILGAFMVLSWMASGLANNSSSKAVQYLGLGIYVLFEAIIFVPMLYIAMAKAGPEVIQTAGFVTLLSFGGLTAIVYGSGINFSFLGKYLMWAGICALGLIVASVVFGFSLGLIFSYGMVAFAGAAILHDTSKIMHEYHEEQYVAASLRLFASIALMFWYVLQIFMRSED